VLSCSQHRPPAPWRGRARGGGAQYPGVTQR
jgi:hypothetical protein